MQSRRGHGIMNVSQQRSKHKHFSWAFWVAFSVVILITLTLIGVIIWLVRTQDLDKLSTKLGILASVVTALIGPLMLFFTIVKWPDSESTSEQDSFSLLRGGIPAETITHTANVVSGMQIIGTQIIQASPDQPQVEEASVWMVPYRRNPFFTGRERLLQLLHDKLADNGTTALAQAQAISGMGGIGKTQTALEYAYRYRHEYKTVLWVRAATLESLLSDFVVLADVLHLLVPEAKDQNIVVATVKRWLAEHTGWLLILDNVDDVPMVADYLPAGDSGHILLTTRAYAVGTLAHRVEIEKMNLDEGVLFLLRRAGLLTDSVPLIQANREVRAQAEAIVLAMDGLPLALEQVGAYIEEVGCSLESYLELYQQCWADLLQRRGKLSPEYPHTVATTWLLSFQQVEQASPGAADLLRLCAFLDPDAIPEALIKEGASAFGAMLKSLAADAFKLDAAMEVLRAFSLVKRNPEMRMLTIHSLVQVVLKDSISHKTQRQWAAQAVRAVNAAFPTVEYTAWPRCQEYLPHALASAKLIEQYGFTFTEAAELLERAAIYLDNHAQYIQAEQLFQRALAIKEKVLPPDHPDIAITLNNLALLYQNQSQYTQAESLFQRALMLEEKVLGPNHSEVATTLGNLARLYLEQGQYTRAEPLLQRALAIEEKALPPDHPDTAIALNNLAQLYLELGQYGQAEPLFQHALMLEEKVLPPGHPSIAIILKNYAKLLRQMSRTKEARMLERRAKAIRAKRSS